MEDMTTVTDRMSFQTKKLASIGLLTDQLEQAFVDGAEPAIIRRLFDKIRARTRKEYGAYMELRKERGF